MSEAILTIAIPTYNRNEILLGNLKYLLPQLDGRCKLLIIDNASPTPVAQTLAPLLAEFPDANVEIRRNAVNIGANINILRGFELCETPWLWILGDDDTPCDDAIEIALGHIEARPGCLYFNFSAGGYVGFHGRPETFETRGLREFVERIENIANALFISSGLYRADVLNEKLRFAYAYAHTQPNFVPLLTGLGEDGMCCLSSRKIVQYNPPASREHNWSLMYFSLGIMQLLELPMPQDVREMLAIKIRGTMPWLETWVIQLLAMAGREGDSRAALFFYDQLCSRVFYFNVTPKMRAKLRIYRLALRFPKQSQAAISRLKRKKATDYNTQELLEGI